MKTRVVASTKVGYELPIEEAIDLSGKEAGICYMPDTVDSIFEEASEKNNEAGNWKYGIKPSQRFWTSKI